MKKHLFAVAFASICLASSPAFAEGYVGALVGVGVPTGLTGISSGLGLGAVVGYRFAPSLAADLTYLHTNLDAGIVDFDVAQLNVGLNYLPFGNVGSRIGIHLGPIFESAVGASDTEFGFGAQAGYDINVTPDFTVGLEVNWTLVSADPESYSLFNFSIPIRYWF